MNNFEEYLKNLFPDCNVLPNINSEINFSIEPIRLFNINERDNLRGVIGATVNNYDRINKDKSEEEKFNVFFDKNNTNAYDKDRDLYTIYFDLNKDYSNNFLFNFNNKFSLLIFELTSIQLLKKLENIKYFLNFLKSDGILFLPVRNYIFDKLKPILYEKFILQYGNIQLTENTYTLTDVNKINQIINSNMIDILPYNIIKNLNNYQPEDDQVKYMFVEKIKRTIDNFDETYEIIHKEYPPGFTVNNFIVIKKK
jgi:hypothetical protein